MKPFWQSKTLWFNALAVVGALFGAGGAFPHVFGPDEVAGAIAGINILLRSFTGQAITTKGTD